MSRWVHGKAVVNGEVKFFSPSSLEKGDITSSTGCPRKWWYRYLMGIDEEPSKSMQEGIDLHERLEHYLKTGDRSRLSSLEISGLHMLPPPGPDSKLLVEQPIVPVNPLTGEEDLSLASLRVAGVPLYGKIDLLHGLGINYGTDDIETQFDPPGTIEADDHKRKKDLNNIKSPKELLDDIQMTIYGKYAFSLSPDVKHVRLAHLYYPVKGAPRKVSILTTPEMIEQTWLRANQIAKSLKEAAREINPDNVEPNTRACKAYGRDCPARSVCKAAKQHTLASHIGATAADRMMAGMFGESTQMSQESPIIPTESIFQKLREAQGSQAVATPLASAPFAPAALVAPVAQVVAPAPVAPVATITSVQSEIERLTALQETVIPQGPELAALVNDISQVGLGFPQLHDAAARDIAALAGATIATGAGLAGAGELNDTIVSDVTQLSQLLALAKAEAAHRAAGGAPRKIEFKGRTEPVVVQVSTPLEEPKVEAIKKAVSPRKKKDKTTEAQVESPFATIGVAFEINGVQDAKQSVDNLREKIEQATGAANALKVATASHLANDKIYFYIGAKPDGIEVRSLWSVVDKITDNLTEMAGGADFRTSTNENLDYGKWKGAVAAAVRQFDAQGGFQPAHYVLEGSHTELAGLVTETFCQVVRKRGGQIIRGTR